MSEHGTPETEYRLSPYLSPAGAWAMALGTSIGWGSLVVTSSAYLSQGGPLGSIFGLLIGAAVMLIISRNYQNLINSFPDAGGVYAYTRESFGYDHAFLSAWFLGLTYLAMFWANATSLPLFARYFLGDVFRFGRLYTIFGYEVYIGEVLITVSGILLVTALLCVGRRKTVAGVMVALAALLSVCITVCFAFAMLKHRGTGFRYDPGFIPDKSAWSQVIRIACISPWAFVGFENISHASEEYDFSRKRVFRVLAVAVLTSTALYIMLIVLSVSAYPEEYDSWLAYIRDLDSISGLRGLPAFYAAQRYLGGTGTGLLVLALLALILTSLIGNLLALSRLFYALAKDGILPSRFRKLNGEGVPANAVLLVAGLSLVIPFVGRTAIGWIVDVTTLGATLIYGFVSACAIRDSRKFDDRTEKTTGIIGLTLMVLLACFLLFPSLFGSGSMAPESYVLFAVWAILGFVFFRGVLKRDTGGRFGQSILVWIALLALILFTSLVWMNETTMSSSQKAMTAVRDYYTNGSGMHTLEEERFMARQLNILQQANIRGMSVVVVLFAVGMGILLNNYTLMQKRARETEKELGNVKRIANTDPLTGVRSKHAYQERARVLNEQVGQGAIDAFAIAICDVNGLKYVNDTYGHKVGDEYIREASRMICEVFDHSPVFRIGGDEFAVLLTGRDYEDRETLQDEIRKRSRENITQEKAVVAIGLAEFLPESDRSAQPVFERADRQMYEDKSSLKRLGAKTR